VFLIDRAVKRPRVQVIDVSAVQPEGEPLCPTAGDESVEKVADVLSVPNTGERLILPPQAEAAVKGNRHKESRLTRREAVCGDRVDALFERHPDSRSSKNRRRRRDLALISLLTR
jgi:hypothetical protein